MTRGYKHSIQYGQMLVNDQRKFSSTALNSHMHTKIRFQKVYLPVSSTVPIHTLQQSTFPLVRQQINSFHSTAQDKCTKMQTTKTKTSHITHREQ